jgi:hypothetical protein
MRGKLYIKFTKNGDYFEIEPEKISPFTTELIDDMPVERKKWGELIIRNNKYQYQKYLQDNPGSTYDDVPDKYKLYDLISDQTPDTEIYVKYIAPNETEIEGYFGYVDCKLYEHKSKSYIKITPTIFDQYTYFLEYYEDEIDVFSENNLLTNGDLDTWIEGVPFAIRYDHPLGWGFYEGNDDTNGTGYLVPSKWIYDSGVLYPLEPIYDYLNSTNCALLPCRIRYWLVTEPYLFYKKIKQSSYLRQSITGIQEGKDINISFYWNLIDAYSPNKVVRQNLGIVIKLTNGTTTRYVTSTLGWSSTEQILVYKTNKMSIPEDEISSFYLEQFVLQDAPISGTLTVYFINNIDYSFLDLDTDDTNTVNNIPNVWYESRLAIADIKIISSDIQYETVNIKLNSAALVTKEQGNILRADGSGRYYRNNNTEMYFQKGVKKGDVRPLLDANEGYIDPDTGVPRFSVLDSDKHGPEENDIGFTVSDLINVFKKVSSEFYKAELTKVTVFRGNDYGSKRHMLAIYEFSREEYYSSNKYTQEDYENGDCELGDIGNNYRPPEIGAGWYETTIINESLGGRLWIRTPYNGAYSDDIDDNWEITEIFDPDDNLRTHEYGFDYHNYVTTERQYPVSDSSNIEYTGCIKLKSIIKRIFNNTDSHLTGKEVYSTFLFNDLPDDTLTDNLKEAVSDLVDSEGNCICNYFTKENNYLTNVVALHTYLCKSGDDRLTDDDDSKLKMSFKSLMDDLMIWCPGLYYFLDSDSNLHIEHEYYEDKVYYYNNIINLIDNYQSAGYDKNKMYATNIFKEINSGYADHSYSKLIFDKIVSNKRAKDIKKEQKTNYLSTDLQYCIENANDLENGLILLCYTEDTYGNKNIEYSTGQRSKSSVLNAKISLANMMKAFGTWQGVWLTGYLNDEELSFNKTIRTRKGLVEINLNGIYENKYFLTGLGIGLAKTKTIDYEKGYTQLLLNYRYSDPFIIVEEDNLLEI